VGELVDQVEHAILPPFVRAVFDEVVGPDMVGSLGAQSDAGPVRKPDAALLGLFGRDFRQIRSTPCTKEPACIMMRAGTDQNSPETKRATSLAPWRWEQDGDRIYESALRQAAAWA
jgi:hypothetical protein